MPKLNHEQITRLLLVRALAPVKPIRSDFMRGYQDGYEHGVRAALKYIEEEQNAEPHEA